MFDVTLIGQYWPVILQGLPVTLQLTAIAMVLGVFFGFIIAFVRMNKVPVLSQLSSFYVSFIRGVPLMVLLYMSYYGLPIICSYINESFGTSFNVNSISPFTFALIAFVMQEAAYESEVIRAAITSVDRKEIEAAKSVGMTTLQTLRRVIIPQALVVAVPSFGNALTSLLKGTSLAFIIAVVDVMGKAKILGGRNFHYFEAYTCAGLTYWILCIVIGFIIKRIEKR
ncbi:amino acid ABC transporter permease [Christensenellaceae bacterium OttesenSCG-928-M15]|nr:amino acid ABC transporter permease [Christensenellaceae bacterium OttesenSCG-928-M15]